MKYSHTEIFEFNNKIFAFDYVQFLLAELDEIFRDIFVSIKEGQDISFLYSLYNPKEIDERLEAINSFIEKDFFFSDYKEKLELPHSYDKGLLSLPTIHECNLRCKYCYADYGQNFKGEIRKFPLELVEKALRYIYLDYMPECKDYRIDFVSGGEPLLNFDVIKEVNRVGKLLYKETGKKLEMWVCTNGTKFTEEILDFFNESHISIGISIDGDQTEHDKNRRDAQGSGTYGIVSGNIKRILSSPKYSNSLKDIWGMVVVSSEVGSLVDILEHHKGMGLKNVQMKIVRCSKNTGFDINKSNLESIKKKYLDLFLYFMESMQQDDFSCLKMILNDNDTFGKLIRRLILRHQSLNRCQAGKNKVSIAANGDLYPCDSFVGISNFKLGSIFTNIDDQKKNIFWSLTVNNNEQCHNCWARYICGGDCYMNSYLTNGDILQPDNVFCDLNKYLIKLAIVLVYNLNLYKPDFVKKITKQTLLRDKMANTKG